MCPDHFWSSWWPLCSLDTHISHWNTHWFTITLIIKTSMTKPLAAEFYSPCVFSKKMTLDSDEKFWPLRIICGPPRTEQWSTSWRSTVGCSWADLWAVTKPAAFMHLILKIWYLTILISSASWLWCYLANQAVTIPTEYMKYIILNI